MNHVAGTSQDFDNHLRGSCSPIEPEMCTACLYDEAEPGEEKCFDCLTRKP